MARPIPKRLLIHTVTHRVGVPDKYGNIVFVDSEIKNVRLEPNKKTVLSALGEGSEDKYLMFWDARYSSPAEFKELDRIIFDGTELTVREVFRAYDDSGLHHLEVYLT